MKQYFRILSAFLVLLMMLSVVVQPAEATEAGTPTITSHPTSVTVTEFTSASFSVQALNARQYVWEVVTPQNEQIPCTDLYDIFPGMEITGCNAPTLRLDNIPRGMNGCRFVCRVVGAEQSVYSNHAGLFVTAQEDTQTPGSPSASDGTPIITKHPGGETVTEGGSATFIARADYTQEYVWEFAIGESFLDCSALASYWGKGVKVSGYNSEKLTISNIPLDLNGSHVRCKFVGAVETVYSDWAEIKVTKDTKVEITEQPAGKAIIEGDSTFFSIKAKNATSYCWELIHPNGESSIQAKDAPAYFEGLKVSGYNTEKLILENVPASLDGWLVRCIANSDDSSATSKSAELEIALKATEPTAPTEATDNTVGTTPTDNAVEAPTQGEDDAVEATDDAGDKEKPFKGKDDEQSTNGKDSGVVVLVIVVCALSLICMATGAVLVIVLVKRKKNK